MNTKTPWGRIAKAQLQVRHATARANAARDAAWGATDPRLREAAWRICGMADDAATRARVRLARAERTLYQQD